MPKDTVGLAYSIPFGCAVVGILFVQMVLLRVISNRLVITLAYLFLGASLLLLGPSALFHIPE